MFLSTFKPSRNGRFFYARMIEFCIICYIAIYMNIYIKIYIYIYIKKIYNNLYKLLI
nr:MAG TPA: hypothetical protein [Bacteriophage sp.]